MPVGYEVVLGNNLIFWTGMIAFLFLLSAASTMGLNQYAKTRFTLNTHKMLAGCGMLFALIHLLMALGII